MLGTHSRSRRRTLRARRGALWASLTLIVLGAGVATVAPTVWTAPSLLRVRPTDAVQSSANHFPLRRARRNRIFPDHRGRAVRRPEQCERAGPESGRTASNALSRILPLLGLRLRRLGEQSEQAAGRGLLPGRADPVPRPEYRAAAYRRRPIRPRRSRWRRIRTSPYGWTSPCRGRRLRAPTRASSPSPPIRAARA